METRNNSKQFKIGTEVVINDIYASYQPILYDQFKDLVFRIDNVVIGMLGYPVFLISNGMNSLVMERRELEIYCENVKDYDMSQQYQAYGCM
jgi:hypothetical protein